ncbi:MAG TPA: endo-1,4-beta-xylanase [Fibrobacteria bacterium]|nr:endo-1,4-beta-xylanase [Fibrobacteria bacterium]
MKPPYDPTWKRLVAAALLATIPVSAQIAKGATKYLGNLSGRLSVPANYGTYWNRIVPENGGKWASVEGTRDRMTWTGLDVVVTFARKEGMPWTFHTLLWGSAYPSWMSAIPKDTLKAEIEEWFTLAGTRYPDADLVVVVNEPNVQHAPPTLFLNALGGKGTTGYDGMIEAFHLARKAFPNAKLILNDYNTIEYGKDHDTCLAMVRALLAAKAPIDGIGIQAHEAYKRPLDTVRKYLDTLAATGLPLHITEFDIALSNDTLQDSAMRSIFPLFWNHPRVAGVTLWGYEVGKTWREGTGLIRADGTERLALVWLKDYVKAHPNPPGPAPISKVRPQAPWKTIAMWEIRMREGTPVVGLERGGHFLSLHDLLSR